MIRAARMLSAFATVAIIVAVVAGAEENQLSAAPSTDPVLQLTASNYESTVFHSGKNGMVKFYQNWCGHCTRFKPTWDQLAHEAHPSVFVARVDCGAKADNDICRSSDITTYPTIRYFLSGTEHEYNGSLYLEELRDFIDSTLVAPCNPILDATTCSERSRKYANKWLTQDGTKVIGEIERLEQMLEKSESSTTAELRRWMRERRDILTIIHGAKMAGQSSDEL